MKVTAKCLFDAIIGTCQFESDGAAEFKSGSRLVLLHFVFILGISSTSQMKN
jgi:hypothetical protein